MILEKSLKDGLQVSLIPLLIKYKNNIRVSMFFQVYFCHLTSIFLSFLHPLYTRIFSLFLEFLK